MPSVFVGGSRSIGRLNEDVINRFDSILSHNYKVLVGDAYGVDAAFQSLAVNRGYRDVSVYYTGEHPRNAVGYLRDSTVFVPNHDNLSGYRKFTLKDVQMAKDADYAFMVWDGKSAGAFQNVFNMHRLAKDSIVYHAPSSQFYLVNTDKTLDDVLCLCDDIDALNKISRRFLSCKL